MTNIIVIGNIASGKSSVVKFLNDYLNNSKIIDLDEIGHQILEDKDVKNQLKELFGEYKNNKELADKAFRNKKSTIKLNNIMHSYIFDAYKAMLEKHKNDDVLYVITEETAYKGKYDPFVQCSNICVCVSADKDLLQSRAIKRGMNKLDFENRFCVQILQSQMEKDADYVVYNNGDKLNLKDQCRKLAKILC